MRRAAAGVAVAAGAMLHALALPPVGASPLAVVALAPLAWAVTTVATWRAALALGVLASLATALTTFYWVPGAVTEFFGIPAAASWLLFPLYGLIAQPQLVVWAVVRWRWRAEVGCAPLLASAALYAGLDWLLPKLFRDTLGVAFYADRWVIQVADLGGLFALTFAAVLVAEVTVSAIAHRRRALPAVAMAAGTWVAILGYGAVRAGQVADATAAAPTFAAGVVQANIGNIDKEIASRGDLDGIVATLQAYGTLSDELARGTPAVDVLVWPETAYPLAYGAHRSDLDDQFDGELATYVRERGVPLLFGGFRRVGDTEYNSALLLAPDGGLAAYHKFHLIPFGEYVPLLGRARFGTGGTPRTLPLVLRDGRTLRVGPIICYEALIPAHAAAAVEAGAQVLVNLTNDSWFVSRTEQELHLAMAAVRSVETRRTQLRATNTGISALILPTGEIVGAGPSDRAAALRYAVPVVELPATWAVRFGAWTGPACLLLAGLWLAWRRFGRRPRPG